MAPKGYQRATKGPLWPVKRRLIGMAAPMIMLIAGALALSTGGPASAHEGLVLPEGGANHRGDLCTAATILLPAPC